MDCVFGKNMGLEFPNAATDSELSQNVAADCDQNTQSVSPKNEAKREPESDSDSEPESEYSGQYLSKIEHLEWCMENIENKQQQLADRVDNYFAGLIIVIGIAIYFAGFAIQSVGQR